VTAIEPTRAEAARAVAVIPARGGSKGLPGKNLMTVGGVSLVARAVHACRSAPSIDAVFVTSDDEAILAAAVAAGAHAIRRPDDIATDSASSEAALIHACGVITAELGTAPDVLVFVQATSPFVDSASLDRAVTRVRDGQYDSMLAAVDAHEFLWVTREGVAHGVNHDSRERLRRQDREPEYRETGAFYVMDWHGFLESKHRFFGRVGIELTPREFAVEIDTIEDLQISRALSHLSPSSLPSSAEVAAVVTDFDGVHTDDRAIVDEEGRESVSVSRSDGLGISRLRRQGMPMLILSKERNPVVTRRGEKLGVEVRQGIDDKAQEIRSWAAASGVDLAATIYIGNDVNDLEAMQLVGWPVAVADAHPLVRDAARFVLTRPGGAGAIRELVDLITLNEGAST
jgi:YrbI family 3-deoxy-D-manno-octulosonate 8-phosphate phosphatase